MTSVFEVVHDQVAVRSAASTKAKLLRVIRRGNTVQGKPLDVDGEPWLLLDATSKEKINLGSEAAWMFVDGRSVGLGQLLRRLDVPVKPKFMPTPRTVSVTSAAGPGGQLSSQLSRAQRVALLEASLAAYRREDFQLELHQTWVSFEGSASEQLEARADICVKVQGPLLKMVLKKPSVAISAPQLLDVFEGHACFREEDSPSKRESELSAWLIWLLSPCAQAAHLRGPPPELSARTAADLAEISGTGVRRTPPRRRVLERVPGAVKSDATSQPNRSVEVQVRAGLSGDLLCSFSAQDSQTVSSLKDRIASLSGIAADEQKLISGERVLRDFDSLHGMLEAEGAISSVPNAQSTSSGASLELKLLRVDSQKVVRLRKLQTGSCNLWDLESADAEDPDYALAAIRRNGLMLKFIPEALKSNLNFIMEAVRLKGDALEYASKELQATPEVVMAAVQGDGNALCHAARSLRDDKSIVLEAVERNGLALRHASDAMRADLEVALAAVEESGMALQYVHPDVASHRDVAITALLQDVRACKFVVPALQQDPSFLAVLDSFGLFEDRTLELLLWIENNHADALRQKGAALFLDARDHIAFSVSHIPGAVSLPHRPSTDDLSDLPGYEEIKKKSSLTIIVYSDSGGETSRCAYIARQLRTRPEFQTHRVLRLVGGLNLWKHEGFDVEGDNREMFAGRVIKDLLLEHQEVLKLVGRGANKNAVLHVFR